MSVQSEIERINNNVANTYSVLEGAGADMPQSRNTNNLPETAASIKAVLYGKAQSLTDPQKLQARKNIGADYGTLFDSFPTEAQIRALPNNSFFTVNAYGSVNGSNKIARYYISTSWTPNSLRYKDSSGSVTIYVVPVDQSYGEIYLPYYGIKQGEGNAENNSAAMTRLLQTAEFGSTFRLPTGHYYFAEPIDLSSKQASLIGTNHTVLTHRNIQGTTWIHFPSLTEGAIALNTNHGTIRDLNICGSSTDYDLSYDRQAAKTNPNNIATETINVKATGLYSVGGAAIENVSVSNFYIGMDCPTSNTFVTDVHFDNCHYGLVCDCDVKIKGIAGSEVMTLLKIKGSVVSVIGVRGDSIGQHLVEITGSNNLSLYDLDADFCVGAIVAIGDGSTVANVNDLVIHNIHGRHAVKHVYPISGTPITGDDLTSETVNDCGLVTIKNGSSINGAIIISGQSCSNSPFDEDAAWSTPFLMLTGSKNTKAQRVQFITSADSGNSLVDFGLNAVRSFSTLTDAYHVRLQTAKGTAIYIQSNGNNSSADEMDLSSYAKNNEVVKTINGIEPDPSGNIDIIEEEPIAVGSIEECVDTSKKYVLPDGYIYACRKRMIPSGSPLFTNQLPISLDEDFDGIYNGVGYAEDRYDSHGGSLEIPSGTFKKKSYLTGIIPCKKDDTIRINNIQVVNGVGANYPVITFLVDTHWRKQLGFDSSAKNTLAEGGATYTVGADDSGFVIVSNIKFDTNSTITQTTGEIIGLRVRFHEGTLPKDVVITVNEEIKYTTEDQYIYEWVSTGEPYVKPDYLAMIADLSDRVDDMQNEVVNSVLEALPTWTGGSY